jgi:hypothetical protein
MRNFLAEDASIGSLQLDLKDSSGYPVSVVFDREPRWFVSKPGIVQLEDTGNPLQKNVLYKKAGKCRVTLTFRLPGQRMSRRWFNVRVKKATTQLKRPVATIQ